MGPLSRVGNINLPLSVEQADVLKAKCTAAPYGRRAQTLVNKSERDAWQVDADIIPHLMGEIIYIRSTTVTKMDSCNHSKIGNTYQSCF